MIDAGCRSMSYVTKVTSDLLSDSPQLIVVTVVVV